MAKKFEPKYVEVLGGYGYFDYPDGLRFNLGGEYTDPALREDIASDGGKIGLSVIEEPGGWRTLEYLKGHDPEKPEGYAWEPVTRWDNYFFRSRAAQDTRQRADEIEEFLYDVTEDMDEAEILSIASGAGRDVMRVVADRLKEGRRVRGTCIDINNSAMELAARIAHYMRVGDNVRLNRSSIIYLPRIEDPGSKDIVIAEGILDYIKEERAKNFMKMVGGMMKPGGSAVLTNASTDFDDEPEGIRRIMETAGGWKLDYKDADTMARIMEDSGFDGVDICPSSNGFYWFVSGKKSRVAEEANQRA